MKGRVTAADSLGPGVKHIYGANSGAAPGGKKRRTGKVLGARDGGTDASGGEREYNEPQDAHSPATQPPPHHSFHLPSPRRCPPLRPNSSWIHNRCSLEAICTSRILYRPCPPLALVPGKGAGSLLHTLKALRDPRIPMSFMSKSMTTAHHERGRQ